MPVSQLKTLDLPTFGLPASATLVGSSRFQRAISPWQESTRSDLAHEDARGDVAPERVARAAAAHQERPPERRALLDLDLGLRQEAERREVAEQSGLLAFDPEDDPGLAGPEAVEGRAALGGERAVGRGDRVAVRAGRRVAGSRASASATSSARTGV